MTSKKIKAWVRLILAVAIVAEIILVFVMNRHNEANLWLFFGVQLTQVPVIWLLIATSLVSIVGFWLFLGIHRSFRDIKQANRTGKAG